MSAVPFVVTPSDYSKALHVVGEEITVLASGLQTGGYEVFLQKGPAGVGPPPHSHDWDETFLVTKGQVVFGMGEHESVATPGTLVHVPAGQTHWFRLGDEGAEMVSMTSRLGASEFFAEVDREVAPGPPDLPTLGRVADRHGIKIGG
ncbi:MAG TPA: cupin domain-containing protein [Caulobacteraceae bacterium]|jgi:quercetin dioxygenase-like cupin family protein